MKMCNPEDIIKKTSSIDKEFFEVFHLMDIAMYLTERQMTIIKMKLKKELRN